MNRPSDPTERFIQLFLENERDSTGGDPPNDAEEQLRGFLAQDARKEGVYIASSQKGPSVLLHARVQPDDFGESTCFVFPFWSESARAAEAELAKAKIHFRDPFIPTRVRLLNSQSELLKSMLDQGFQIDCYELMGRIDAAPRYLSGVPRTDLSHGITRLQTPSKVTEVVDLVARAHASDSSSRVQFDSEEKRSSMMGHFKMFIEHGTVLVATHQDQLIGTVGLLNPGANSRSVLIGSLAVHPDFQGHGLSRCLYKAALEEAEKNGAIFYVGFTSTNRILSSREKMGRKIRAVFLKEETASQK